jgi:coenzyme F420 hydrogenase subunit beta
MADPKVDVVESRYQRLLETAEDPHDWAFAWRSELNRGGFRAVDFLMDEVIDAGKCLGCAACVTICPTDVFGFADELPTAERSAACVQCVLCADVCPVLRPPDTELAAAVSYREPVTDEGYGPYSYELLARATDPAVLERAQDGGVVTALLLHELERGRIEGAVLGDVDPENPQLGMQRLARTPSEVVACKGSRYTYSPNTLALREAIEQDVRPIAVVGVPCQITGLRQEQHSGIRTEMNRWYRSNVPLAIGLFCSEAFTHESVTALSKEFDVPVSEIENINIKGKVVVRLKGGEVKELSLKRFREYARPACHFCLDYAADYSDLAAGGMGLDGWSYTVVRTEAGHNALQAAIEDGLIETAPIDNSPKSKPLLMKLAQSKAKRTLPALMEAPE